LKRLAESGRTVVCVLHQPRHSIFTHLVDAVALVAKGKLVYCGSAQDAPAALERMGAAPMASGASAPEYLLDGLSELRRTTKDMRHQPPSYTHESMDAPLLQPTVAAKGPRRSRWAWLWKKLRPPRSTEPLPSGPLVQTVAVFQRQLLQHYRRPFNFVVFVAAHVFVGALLGVGFLSNHGLFIPPIPTDIAELCPPAVKHQCLTEPIKFQDLKLSALFLSLALGTGALVSAVRTFGLELELHHREAGAGASTVCYFIGKNLAELPFAFIGALVFGATYVPMLRPASTWATQFGIFCGVEFAAMGLGYFLSTLVSIRTAHVTGVVSVFAFTVMSGISPKLRMVKELYGPVQVFWLISFPLYAVEASFDAETTFFLKPGHAFDESTKRFAKEYGFELGAYATDIIAMVAIGVGWRVLACIALWWKHRPCA